MGIKNNPPSAKDMLTFLLTEISEESLFEFLAWISAIQVTTLEQAEYVAKFDTDASQWLETTYQILWKSSPANIGQAGAKANAGIYEMSDSISARIVEDYKGLLVGAETHQVSTAQLHSRIRRTIIAAAHGELDAEYKLPSQNSEHYHK